MTGALTAVDCQSFAGGLALGIVRGGFTLLAKREQEGAFGTDAMEGNRHLLGTGWTSEDGPADTWTPVDADLVFGNPPCSGFSQMTNGDKFGQAWRDKQNECMVDLVEYASKCRPRMVIMESVQAAYHVGRPLMQRLRALLEERTGQDDWTLYHVLHNVADLGGTQDRPRYFMVLSRVPFGVTPARRAVKTLRDAIGDLEHAPLNSVPGHDVVKLGARGDMLRDLALTGDWAEGERANVAHSRHPDLPMYKNDLRAKGSYTAVRLRYDKPCPVIVGDSYHRFFHPTQPRLLTLRELARLTGFPDQWSLDPYLKPAVRGRWLGKGVTVWAGTWIGAMAASALGGQPRPYRGELIGDREYLIDNQTAEDTQ